MTMTATELRPAFRRRFRGVARQMWSLHVGRGMAMTVLVATALLGSAALVDYVFELSWPARSAVFGVGVAAAAFVAAKWIFAPARVWRWSKVAAELEGL